MVTREEKEGKGPHFHPSRG